MYNEKEIKFIKCDFCKQPQENVFYWSVLVEDEEEKISLENAGLYCGDCFTVIKNKPIAGKMVCENTHKRKYE